MATQHNIIPQNEMAKAIVELLRQNNRVIVPNFGAFILSQGTNDKVLFNNFLSFNDGLLVGHLCQEKSLAKSDVLIEVNNFVELIRTSLDAKGEITLNELGVFTKDHNNVLRFTQAVELSFGDYPSFENTATSPATAPKDLLDIDMAAPLLSKEDEKPEDSLPPIATNNRLLTIDGDKQEAASRPIEKQDDDDTNFVKANKEEPTATVVPPAPIAKPVNPKYQQPTKPTKQKETVYHSEKKKRSMGWFVLLFILLPLLALVYFLGVHQNRYGWLTPKAEQPTVQQEPPAPAVVEEPAKPKPEPVANTADKKYQIIVASKSNEEAAREYAQELVTKGFPNAHVIARSGKFLVSIDGGDDWVQTEFRQEEIVNKYRIESYLLSIK
jgi:nucleoid DNA-binding protein